MARAASLAYGALALPLSFAALPIYVHVPRFYAETAGLELALLGAILLGARLFDAFIDPWLGWLADRLPRRRMLAISLGPFALGFFALFHPPAGASAVWLLGALLLTYVGFSSASVAYQAWGAAAAENATARTRLTAAREGFGLLGVVLAAALPTFLAPDLSTGTQRLAWILPPLLLLTAGITFTLWRAADGVPVVAPGLDAGLKSGLRRSLRDPVFRRLLGVFVANGIAAALPATLFLFFVADVLGMASAGGPLLALYFLAGAASLPVWVSLSIRYGRVRAWAGSMLLAMLAFAGTASLGQGDIELFALICLASGLALGADLALPAAIVADLGKRQAQPGAYFGLWNFVAKLNLALAAGLALPLLDGLGYRPGESGGESVLTLAYALLPLLFKLLALALLWRWREDLEIRS